MSGPRGAWWSGFGTVSLAADMVYEGARSVYGPLLASLGASAVVVGAVTGAGEAAALIFRVLSGPLADRTRRYWALTIAGYALTAVCVPLLAVTPFLGAAGLAVATVLILAERLGKAVRSPAKSALLADAAAQVGMGRGLGVHKALDQIGAFAGPLLVAGLVALTGVLWPALAALAVPGAVAMVLLVVTRRRLPEPEPPSARLRAEPDDGRVHRPAARVVLRLRHRDHHLHRRTGHVRADQLLPGAAPCRADGGGAPAVRRRDGRRRAGRAAHGGGLRPAGGARAARAAVAGAPPSRRWPSADRWRSCCPASCCGVRPWVCRTRRSRRSSPTSSPRDRRATAYGFFAAVQGAGALIGGIGAGVLYDHSVSALVAVIAASQVAAFLVIVPVVRRARATAA